MTFYVQQGDRLPSVTATLQTESGPVDLTGASVSFRWGKPGEAENARVATIVSAEEGSVSYSWQAGETDDAGVFRVRWVITFGDGRNQTIPGYGFDSLVVWDPADATFTFGDMKEELRRELWPQGEAENLVAAHDRMFVDAMIDAQRWVKCLHVANTQIFPFCSTLFQCGLTVMTAPRGRILRVFVVDKINEDTCLEDGTAPTDWCNKVEYKQVEYCRLQKFVSEQCACSPLPATMCMATNTYPPPDDGGYEGYPELPLGFHYPQTDGSTDSPCGRALSGTWALDRGKIYIAPRIQSTETVIVIWDGIKRDWSDFDVVDDDPTLKRVISYYVLREHYFRFEKDNAQGKVYLEMHQDALADLAYECRQETMVRGCEGSDARQGQS